MKIALGTGGAGLISVDDGLKRFVEWCRANGWVSSGERG